MKRTLAVSLVALVAVLIAPDVSAQDDDADIPKSKQPTQGQAETGALADAVELKNGAYLRGLILEVDPTSHLTLKLPTGEVRQIPIAEVASAERSGKPLKLPGMAAVAAPVAKPPPPSSDPSAHELDRLLAAIPGPRVKLTLDANRDAFLERQIGDPDSDYTAYHVVCKVPCKMELPALDPVRYRIDGRRTEATEWFQLPRYNARVKADLVSNMWPLWPRALLVGGFIFSLTGGGMLAGWALADGSDAVRNVGIGLAATGGVLFLASGVMFLVRPESSFSVERQP
ncbi:MAG TPA: hypothetical protein VF103_07510 [Polyangiaceae bacterium]